MDKMNFTTILIYNVVIVLDIMVMTKLLIKKYACLFLSKMHTDHYWVILAFCLVWWR